MSFLYDQLLSIEDGFLEALADGGPALSAFEERWEKLLADVNRAFDSGSLDDETTVIAHTTAVRIATLAETSAELLARRDEIDSDLMDQIDTLMSQLTVSDCDITVQHSSLIPKHAFAHRSTSLDEGDLGLSKSRKRRRDDMELPAVESSTHLSKRMRHPSCPEKYCVPIDPSPFQCPLPLYDTLCHPIPTVYTPPSPTNSRKRRLSDTDLSSSPSRPKRPYAGSRPHTASDSHSTYIGRGSVPRLPTTCLPAFDILNEEQSIRSGVGCSISSKSPSVAPPSDTFDVNQTPEDCDSLWNRPPLPELVCSDLHGLDGFLKSLLDCSVVSTFPGCLSPSSTAVSSLGSPSPSQSSVSLPSNSSCPSPSPSVQSLPITPPLCAVIDTAFLPSFDSIDSSLSFDYPTACNPLETYLPASAPVSATSDLDLASLFDSDRSCMFPPADPSSVDSYWRMPAMPSDFP